MEKEKGIEVCAQCAHRRFPWGLGNEGECALVGRVIHATDNACDKGVADPFVVNDEEG